MFGLVIYIHTIPVLFHHVELGSLGWLHIFTLLVNIPVVGIRLLQQCGLSLVSSAPKKWRLTRWPVDLFKKEALKGNSEVHLHTPSKFGEDLSKDLRGVGEQTNKQTDRQTDRQTDKRCSNYSMMIPVLFHHAELGCWGWGCWNAGSLESSYVLMRAEP